MTASAVSQMGETHGWTVQRVVRLDREVVKAVDALRHHRMVVGDSRAARAP